MPVVDPTVPFVGILLLQVPVPPDAAGSLNVMVSPVQTVVAPDIAPIVGVGLTVTTCVTLPQIVV